MPEATPGWVWAEELSGPGGRVILAEEDSRYVVRVCRARAGEAIALTDGRGAVARGRVDSTAPRVVVAIEALERLPETRRAVLLCGPAEGPRFDWAVEKLAELGVTSVRPVHCARARWEKVALRADRWRRLARAALLQSRGRFLLEVEPPAELEATLASSDREAFGVLADSDGGSPGELMIPPAGTTVGVVGPAEGLTDQEKTSILGRGFQSIALSASRLRTETAAVAWAAWWASAGASQSRGKATTSKS